VAQRFLPGAVRGFAQNVLLGGCTVSIDFPTTAGAYQRVFGGTEAQNAFMNFGDGFVVKLNPTGSTFLTLSGEGCNFGSQQGTAPVLSR
jgi:hypothetical protein